MASQALTVDGVAVGVKAGAAAGPVMGVKMNIAAKGGLVRAASELLLGDGGLGHVNAQGGVGVMAKGVPLGNAHVLPSAADKGLQLPAGRDVIKGPVGRNALNFKIMMLGAVLHVAESGVHVHGHARGFP